MNKAEYYHDKAESIENNDAIFSDDPEAIQKLQEKLKNLQDAQTFMKGSNRFIKKKDKVGCLAMQFATEKIWVELTTPNHVNRIGFAAYRLTNNNANIRRVESRIKELQEQESKGGFDQIIQGIRAFENKAANRTQLIFESKPCDATRQQLKGHGFRWAPSEGAWQRHISASALYWAKYIVESEN